MRLKAVKIIKMDSSEIQTTSYRMQTRTFRLQVGFLSAMALFSLIMTILILRRGDSSPTEYIFWIALFAVWVYGFWYAFSARLFVSPENIEFRAAFNRISADWSEIDHVSMEPAGPALVVQESNQAGKVSAKGKPKKIPLYLFMKKWKSKSDWEEDELGRTILSFHPQLFQGSSDN